MNSFKMLARSDVHVKVINTAFRPTLWLAASLCILLSSLPAPAQELMPEDPILLKGEALYREGNGRHARSVFQEYLQLHPRSVEARLWLARLARRNYDFDQARKHLEAALSLSPDRADVLAELAYLHYQWSITPVGQPALYLPRAEEYFSQARSLASENPYVLTYLAEFQLHNNDRISAEHNLQKVIQQYPAFVPAYHALIRFYIEAGDVSRAKDTAMHAVELDANEPLTHFLIARLMQQANHPAEAVKYAQRSERLDFGSLPERDFFLARELERLGDLKEAARYYERLVGYAPEYAQGWLRLGELYGRLASDDPVLSDKSIQAYQKAIALDATLLDDMIAKAQEATRLERPGVALPQWRKLVSLTADKHPRTQEQAFGAIAGLHYSAMLNEKPTPASAIQNDLKLLTRASSPDNPSPRLMLDRIKLEWALAQASGHEDPLNPELEERLKILSWNESDPFTAGEAHFLLGNYGQAQEQFALVDGLNAEEYTHMADRLLLERALVFATVFYQRAYEDTRDRTRKAGQEKGINRIKHHKSLADQALQMGNQHFKDKQYKEAADQYRKALQVFPEWETAYLRLGDTCQVLRQWTEAHDAFEKAVSLNPGLMDSSGFAKNFNKTRKRAKR